MSSPENAEDNAELEGILNFARNIHRESLAEARVFFAQREKSLTVDQKADKTFVTNADKTIEENLRKKIVARFPQHEILGEEEGFTPGQKSQIQSDKESIQQNTFSGNFQHTSDWTWVLDPIDGTFSFVHGVPFYSSLLCVYYKGTPTIGFASLPELEITMEGCTGKNTFIVEKNNRTEIIKNTLYKSQLPHSCASNLFSCADFYRFHMEKYEHLLPHFCGTENKFRVYCDALAYFFLLSGTIQVFVDPKAEIWDVAPFYPILKGAGMNIHRWKDYTSHNHPSNLNVDIQVSRPQRGTSVSYNLAKLSCGDQLDILLSILREAEQKKEANGLES